MLFVTLEIIKRADIFRNTVGLLITVVGNKLGT